VITREVAKYAKNTINKEIRIALGIDFLGFLASSELAAILSN
jgi:hypothetical protein